MRLASRKAVLLAATLTAFSVAGGAPSIAEAKPVLLDKIVAVVDGRTIFRSDVLDRARPQVASIPMAERTPARMSELHKKTLDRMIDQVLVQREARAARLDVQDSEIAAAREAVAKQNGLTVAKLEAEVLKAGYTREEYDDELRRTIYEQKWILLRLRPKVNVPSTDEKAFAAALEVEREKAMTALRAKSIVEVRW